METSSTSGRDFGFTVVLSVQPCNDDDKAIFSEGVLILHLSFSFPTFVYEEKMKRRRNHCEEGKSSFFGFRLFWGGGFGCRGDWSWSAGDLDVMARFPYTFSWILLAFYFSVYLVSAMPHSCLKTRPFL